MQHILIPTDFSPAAARAIAYGSLLAREYGAKVTLAYIHSMPMDPMRIGEVSSELYRDGEALLEDHAEQLRAEGLTVDTEVQLGTPVSRLKSIILKRQVDLVVMGCQGRHHVASNLFGSTTTSLMEEVTVPILAVPLNYQPRKPERILWAADSKVPKGSAMLEPMLELAERSGSELQVFHYQEADERELPDPKFKELLADVSCDIYVQVDNGLSVDIAIRDFVEKTGVDLITVIHRRTGWLNRLAVASSTRRAVFTSAVPILILQEK
ncbi:nucleotide-binding universal stress UspA family protein [Neolewinella xylanilytica]|uniref:Nucleotide-binding universal stress UspA family protein n=1 Tax=Neolewinella xylanilytica TaxID=1514080 RepID=A0A2S6I7Z4_9BACT|nr:universal stress protein [Neolewinella xylanilytica]PPK87611.1 nucleotide-binding universal stress UspA family protein [Neolewinella xylanilytica]